MQDKCCFISEAVYGINDVVIVLKLEFGGGILAIESVDWRDVAVRADFVYTLGHGVDFDSTDSSGRSHELAVDVGNAHAIGIDQSDVLDAASYQAFYTPKTITRARPMASIALLPSRSLLR